MGADTYSHGHDESVLRSHRWRTAANSAGYLLGRLRPGQRLLDAGCGPGTISVELAQRVAPGEVVAFDLSADAVDAARDTAAAAACDNVTFATGDVYAIDAPDASFDVAHAHQVLQHLTDPVAALGELRRVLRPGGLLAVRDSDYGAFVWAPADARLDRWMAVYHGITARNGAEADAGRLLPTWLRRAGFTELTVSSSTWTFTDAADRQWWGQMWADRVLRSNYATQAKAYGLAGDADLEEIADGFRSWASGSEGLFVVVHVEVLATA